MTKIQTLRATLLAALFCAVFATSTAWAQDAPEGETAVTEAVEAPESALAPDPAPEPEAAAEPTAEEPEAPAVTADSPAAARLLDHLLEIAASLLMLMLSWAAMKAKTWFSEKTKIEIPAMVDAQVMRLAEKATGYAESKARQFLAEKGEKMAGPDKLEAALKFGLDLAEAQNLPKWSKEKLEDYVEAKLGMDRLAAEG